jgi:ureidoacrylate peracid hydrolase
VKEVDTVEAQILDTKRLSTQRSAVLVVDVQNDFCHPDGACAQRGSDVSAIGEMLPRLERFLTSARSASVPVLFIRTFNDEGTESGAWRGRFAGTGRRPTESPTVCYTESWGSEFHRVAPAADERVLTKHRYSAFAGTSLDLTLRTAGIESVIVTGVATNICVDSTLRDALSLDYHVTLVEDCCAAFDTRAHAATVDTVGRYFGLVADSELIRRCWAGSESGPP